LLRFIEVLQFTELWFIELVIVLPPACAAGFFAFYLWLCVRYRLFTKTLQVSYVWLIAVEYWARACFWTGVCPNP